MYSKIVAALDGSDLSRRAGEWALAAAAAGGAEVIACHIYGAGLHGQRFREMEPGLPEPYREPSVLRGLREAHDGLIARGFQSLSEGYLDAFVAAARAAGVRVSVAAEEGRNYVRLLELARRAGAGLIALGAAGLGDVGDGQLGSTAARVLRQAPCDVLIARAARPRGPVVAGIDGSEAALESARRAAAWARRLGRPLHLAAAYDPVFHTTVFRAMARTLSAARSEDVGLARQESLHDEIINDGLGKLYQGFLDDARQHVLEVAVEPHAALLQGKAYVCVGDYARGHAADLLVVGRFGHHRENGSDLGATAEAVARLAPTSVLVTGGAGHGSAGPSAAASAAAVGYPQGAAAEQPRDASALEWDADALARLERVPSFVRPMARQAIEREVRAKGGRRVTQDDFEEVARRFGMGGRG